MQTNERAFNTVSTSNPIHDNADIEPENAHEPESGEIQGSKHFETILGELTALKAKHVDGSLEWYKKHTYSPMRNFRLSSILLIILSASVPLLSILNGVGQEIVLPAVSVAIATLTGMLTFFNWHGQWTRFVQAKFTIENLMRVWDLEIFKAKHHPNEQEAINLAVDATERLLTASAQAVAQEMGQFSEAIQKLQSKS